MRYLAILGLLIALGLVISLAGTVLTKAPSRPSYSAATGAAKKATDAAQQRVQDVLKNMNMDR